MTFSQLPTTYEIYVSSGHMDQEFSFILKTEHAEILKKDKYRAAVLAAILHDVLQGHFGNKSDQIQRQSIFEEIADRTLHSNEVDLRKYIDDMSTKLNVAFDVYIKKRFDSGT